jgi:hypothetical protein
MYAERCCDQADEKQFESKGMTLAAVISKSGTPMIGQMQPFCVKLA